MEYTPYFDTLRKTRLLRGMTDAELTLLTESLAPRVRRYDKGELLLMAGYETKDVGIILEGEITATKPMPDGTPIIDGPHGAGRRVCRCAGRRPQQKPGQRDGSCSLPGAVPALRWYAAAKRRVAAPPTGSCCRTGWRRSADKYFSLDCRLELLCCKSLRGRICLWLLEQRDQTGSDTFTITMTRAELAAYLNCDRSALSRELSRMQEDGLIELFRSTFKLLDPERLANEM